MTSMTEQVQWIAAVMFALAIVHTFSTGFFERLAHRRPQHAGVWHLLGEVEVVFGVWAMLLVVAMALLVGRTAAVTYVDSRDYTEPMFVFAIMVIAASRPVLHAVRTTVTMLAVLVPAGRAASLYFLSLSALPLMGSFITEPAAMTVAALMLREQVYRRPVSARLKYATLGALFVNVSIGGTLTNFAAPPVLMVADTWRWDTWHMLTTFGWKSALAVLVNAAAITFVFRRELGELPPARKREHEPLPPAVIFLHLLLLAGVVGFAHHPPVFLALLLFFLGLASAYPRFQDRVMLREALLVAFFLAGLVVLGGQQQWWLSPLLRGMDASTVFYAATALTAVTDNAAITYLASLVEGLSDEFKYSVVAGAVTGGGLTVIANAPNPAGLSILRRHFPDEAVNPLALLAAALPPTLVAMAAFLLL